MLPEICEHFVNTSNISELCYLDINLVFLAMIPTVTISLAAFVPTTF